MQHCCAELCSEDAGTGGPTKVSSGVVAFGDKRVAG